MSQDADIVAASAAFKEMQNSGISGNLVSNYARECCDRANGSLDRLYHTFDDMHSGWRGQSSLGSVQLDEI